MSAPIQVSIAQAIQKAGQAKTWDHDRTQTVGASEIGQCLRRVWFLKNEVPADDGHIETRGAAERGDLIERYHWAPRLAKGISPLTLEYAGENQKTLIDGYVSATPDGIVINYNEFGVTFEGIDMPPGSCVLVECKSIDPRVNLDQAKAEHRFQAQMQIGLVKECTNLQPIAAVVSYVNASFLDDIKTFIVPADAKVYEAGKQRAVQVMTAKTAAALPPEGYIAGGKECENCPWARQCGQTNVGRVPGAEQAIGEEYEAELVLAATRYAVEKEAAEEAEKKQKQAAEAIKQILERAKTRKGTAGPFRFSWVSIDGKTSLDIDAMKRDLAEAGIDLSKYEIAGRPYDRLTVSRTRAANRPDGQKEAASSKQQTESEKAA